MATRRDEGRNTDPPAIPQAPAAAPPTDQRSPYAARPQPPAQPPRPAWAPPPEMTGGQQPGGQAPATDPGTPPGVAIGPMPDALPAIAKPPLDAVSVAAVVTGLLGLGPIALVLGAIGLRRTTKNWLRSPRIAGIGLGLGIVGTLVWLGVAVAAALGGFSGPSTTPTPGDVDAPRTVHARALATGNCIATLPPQQEVGELTLVPCSTEHLAQVLSVTEFGSGVTYPGPDGALSAGEEMCSSAFDALDETRFLRWVLVPTAPAWDDGVRTVACIARSQQGQITIDLVN